MNRYYTLDKVLENDFRPLYLQVPYLSILSNDELIGRLKGLINNIVEFQWDFSFKIFVKNNMMGLAFMDAIYEFEQRGVDPIQYIKEKIVEYETRKAKIDIAKVNSIANKIHGHKVLFRYTESRFEDFWMSNNVWFNLSEEYKDEKLDDGIRDDEQNLASRVMGLRLTNLRTGKTASVKNNEVVKHITSYFISSYSTGLSAKQFALLSKDYDICIIIDDADRYVEAIKYAISVQTDVVYFGADKVEYLDANRQIRGKKNLFFQKKLEFEYENEYRVVFIPVMENRKNYAILLSGCEFKKDVLKLYR